MKHLIPFVIFLVTASTLSAQPLFPNSIASNDLDFIRADDPGACWSMIKTSSGPTAMYDPRHDTIFVDGALHFDVAYPDQNLRINVHPAVGDPVQRATQAAQSIARLPTQMRLALNHVNILDGDGRAWSEDAGRFFTLYDGMMERRLAEHDLDETVFHETAHVAFDLWMPQDPDWLSNQVADDAFITNYAADHPNKEDIAESALFVWTMIYHPERLPAEIEATVRTTIPGRLEYLGNVLDGFTPPACPS